MADEDFKEQIELSSEAEEEIDYTVTLIQMLIRRNLILVVV
ncbi:hypothetical protein BVRB_5g107540 [Beta vulgaris subsp. vulgaris]|nr:hypothetical protein BVRB_5g107540 [Beta vulgaris subsp. vulgaris]